jgi:hypothetical protein
VHLVISNCGLQDDKNEGVETLRKEVCRSRATQASKHGIVVGVTGNNLLEDALSDHLVTSSRCCPSPFSNHGLLFFEA